MIVFDVKCARDHVFEGWFQDSATFEAQAAAGEIACPVCGSVEVSKALMAPAVSTRRSSEPRPEGDGDSVSLAKARDETGKMLAVAKALRDHVEKNFDNVGPRFAEEARRIHYGETGKRSIYGQATREEARELKDEGVEFGALPDLPRHDA